MKESLNSDLKKFHNTNKTNNRLSINLLMEFWTATYDFGEPGTGLFLSFCFVFIFWFVKGDLKLNKNTKSN